MKRTCLGWWKIFENISHETLYNTHKINPCNMLMQKRCIAKHFLPQWKRDRRRKYLVTPQLDYGQVQELQGKTIGEQRALMKMKGVVMPHQASYSVNLLESGGQIYSDYIPREGDSATNVVAKAKDWGTYLKGKQRSRKAGKTLRSHIPDFRNDEFPEEAQAIYEEAHTLLTRNFPREPYAEYRKNQDEWWRLHELVTESGWQLMTDNLDNKTLRWKLVESIEAPRIVCQASGAVSGHDFVQLTVRFHTKQIVALYDRFGRLMNGHPTLPRDVLDFILFERRVSDSYGQWRIHNRLKPEWKKYEPNDITNSYLMDQKTNSDLDDEPKDTK